MKKQTVSPIITHFLRTAFILVLLVLVIKVIPGAIGQRMSKEALKAQATRDAVMKESAKADVPSVRQPAPRPLAPAVCTLDGVLGSAPPGGATGNLPARLSRPGTAAATCAAPTAYPGPVTGTFIYNVHNITNPNGAPLCTNVTLHYVSGGTATVNIQHAAFLSPFAPADISNSARYLADPSLSSGNPPTDLTFGVNVPANGTIALVVWSANASPASQGAAYQLILDQDAFCGPPAPTIAPAGSALIKEDCTPNNNVIDPSETVIVNLTLTNSGAAPTTNLVATLGAVGGVANPSGPQNYGVISIAGTATRSFSFTANSSLACGDTITATLQLNDNGNPLPNVAFAFPTGALVPSFSENFDSVAPPALPAGWTADQGVNVAGAPPWVTSNAGVPVPVADSPPNAAFTPDPDNTCDNRIYTPVVVYSTGSRLIFRQNYDLEPNSATVAYDAGVLEISINGGAYTDIVSAGGTFVTGGYNHTDINTGFSNPLLPTRPNWSGISNGGAGGFETCSVTLPASGAGQPVQFRWRMGSDTSVSHNGWRIDNVTISKPVCCQAVLDHFKAYQLPTTPPPLNVTVGLQDQFDVPNFQNRVVLEPFRFANPVDKDRNGTITPRANPDEHLKLYNLSPVTGPTPTRIVDVYNQFGQQRLTVQASRLLAVPTIKNNTGTLQTLDHFQCYDCTGQPLNVVVNLTDQFHFEPNVQVLQPRYFCNPVVKLHNGTTPILHPTAHLVFYAINPQPPFNISALTTNQFGTEPLQLKEADLLGVPTVKQVVLLRAVSRKIHGGAGTFDLNLPLTGTPGVECRVGQGGGTDHQMVVTYLNPVTVGGAAVTSGTGNVVGPPSVSGGEVTINLTGVTNAQTIVVTLQNVSDGVKASNWTVPMSVLLGDTSGNGAVTGTDVSQTKLQSGQVLSGSNFRNDVVVSGSINGTDVSSVKLKSGTALPP